MRKSNFNYRYISRYISGILIIIFSIIFLTAGMYSDETNIESVRDVLKRYYVDGIPSDILNQPTIEDIIKEINKTDPYTQYFTPVKYQDFVGAINNTYSVIGMYFEAVPDGVKVVSVMDNTPAKRAGIKPGDIIVMAGQHMLTGLADEVSLGYIKGIEGTNVNLKIIRGSELISLDVASEKITNPTVEQKVLDKHIGYVRIITFGNDTGEEFSKALTYLKSKKVDSYIIDLRYNPGGFINTALDIAGYFIGANIALITKDRIEGESKNYAFEHEGVLNKPIIFLVNHYSASASEILSAAVKDYGKAYFVGEKTYGKGCIQEMFPFPNGDVLKFTIQRFYSPKGAKIHGVGITPNFTVPDEIDSMRIGELVLNSPKTLKNTRGYIKTKLKDREVIVNINQIKQKDFWPSFRHLLLSAAPNGVFIGNGKGWTKVSKDLINSPIKLIYPTFKELPRLKNVGLDSEFTVQFSTKILKSSVTDANIEFFDASTGDRISTNMRINGNELTVSPKDNLVNGKTYYLIVHPEVKRFDNKSFGYGMINIIDTVK